MSNKDFMVKNGFQVYSNLVVGSYYATNAAPIGGAIISGNVGIGTANPILPLVVQNDLSSTSFYANLNVPSSKPTLFLNFLSPNSQLDSRINFSRSSQASAVSITGNIVLYSNNVPIYEYNPVTQSPLGLRIESGRTNYLGNNLSFGTNWGASGSTINYASSYSLDGSQNASNVVITTTGGDTGYMQQTFSIITGGTTYYTTSIFAQYGNNTTINLYNFYIGTTTAANYVQYNFSTGIVSAGTAEGPGVFPPFYGVTQYVNGWIRLWLTTYDPFGTNNSLIVRVYASTRGSAVSGTYTYYWGAQTEIGNYPTSLIYNPGSSSLSRSPDIAYISPISSWFNPNQGTIKVSAMTNYLTPYGYQNVAEIVTASTNSGIQISHLNVAGNPYNNVTVTTSNNSIIYSNSANSWNNSNVGTTTVTYQQSTGIYASAFNLNVVNSTVNSSPLWSTTTPDTLNLGNHNQTSNFLDGYITSFSYYPTVQSNAIVQSFSL